MSIYINIINLSNKLTNQEQYKCVFYVIYGWGLKLWKSPPSFPLYLLEELQVHGHLKETSHGAGAVCHEALLAEGDWLSLGTRKPDLMTIDSPLLAKTPANCAASSESHRQMFCLTALTCLSSSPVAINYIMSHEQNTKKSCQKRSKACWENTLCPYVWIRKRFEFFWGL